MTEREFDFFLVAGAWTCAAFAALNLLMIRRRGWIAMILSAAFLVMGGTLLLAQRGADRDYLIAGGVLVAALLITDAFFRVPNSRRPTR